MDLIQLAHDDVVKRLRAVAARVELGVASDAFLASLGSASLRYRTTLAHLAYALNFPEHTFEPSPGQQSYMCLVCGSREVETVNLDEVREFVAKGDATIGSPTNALLDLEDFEKLDPPTPTDEDIACFDAMIATVAELPPSARATELLKRWGAHLPRSNRYNRGVLVEILGALAILDTPDHPGYFTRWVGKWENEEVPALNGDLRPPAAWWRGSVGVNRGALDLVFPQKGIDRSRFSPRPSPVAFESGATKIPKKGSSPARTLEPGDLVGFRHHERWLAGVVVGRHMLGEKAIPILEFYRGSFESEPTPITLTSVASRIVGPFREAPTWRRELLAIEGMEYLGSVMPVETKILARAQPSPASNGLIEEHYRVVATRNLLYLLCTLRVDPLAETV